MSVLLSLIKNGMFEDALAHLGKDDNEGGSDRVFLIGYCHYRLERYDEGLQGFNAIGELSPQTVKLHSLKAQFLFKVGKFKEAASIYLRLMQICPERTMEWSTNRSACICMITRPNDEEKEYANYESLYNKATGMLMHGSLTLPKWIEIEGLLLKAIDLCENTLKSEGYERAEIDLEVAQLKCQLSYLYYLQAVQNSFDSSLMEKSLAHLEWCNQLHGLGKSLAVIVKWNSACLKHQPSSNAADADSLLDASNNKFNEYQEKFVTWNHRINDIIHGKRTTKISDITSQPGSLPEMLFKLSVMKANGQYEEALSYLGSFGSCLGMALKLKCTVLFQCLLGQDENAWKSIVSQTSLDESVFDVKVILGQSLNKDISDVIEKLFSKNNGIYNVVQEKIGLQYAMFLFQRKGASSEALEFLKKYKLNLKKDGAALSAAIHAKDGNFMKAKESLSPFLSLLPSDGSKLQEDLIRNPFGTILMKDLKKPASVKPKNGKRKRGKRFRNFTYSLDHKEKCDKDRWLPKSVKKQRNAKESQGGDTKGITANSSSSSSKKIIPSQNKKKSKKKAGKR